MRSKIIRALFVSILVIIAFTVWRTFPLDVGNVKAGPLTTSSTTNETWNLGFTVEGAPTYNAIIGRVAEEAGAFRSNRGVTQMATIFPAPATARTVDSARLYILSRNGSYGGTMTLSLRIYNFAGVLQHTVSSAGIDLQTAATGTWMQVPLSATADNLVVSPGEFLSFHVELSGASAGNLDVRPVFDVTVRQ